MKPIPSLYNSLMFSREQLDAIDQVLLQDGLRPIAGQDPPWYGGGAFDAKVPKDLREHGVVGVSLLDPLRPRSKYERSRWMLVREAEDETKVRFAPELHLRGTLLVGKLELFHMPAWTGPDEVKVFTKTASQIHDVAPAVGKFGAPAGSREYYQAWRKANRDKVKANNRKHQQKLRALLKSAKREASQPDFEEMLKVLREQGKNS